ncbi:MULTISPECIES: carbohydrate binding domain-containing protein [Streptomyces]|uniref:CBM-cenC domain-containing protein n=1 Tax=Streptomyces lycii TaxID=2654337 RepID=A0ABQ7FGW4_9ACTN|nr:MULTISPECIES: carbohydrate binding domain-containing protein [Streptomyces]KAF4407609.1 hypothetical protein GCU69_18620 [Streptomyces lycii]PGH47149.1 hypothetical protein CRI70_30185 [Streptomyces sp. Ru87]
MSHTLRRAPRAPGRTPGARPLLAVLALTGLACGALAAPAAAAGQAAGPELVVNGDFEEGVTAPWWWTENNPASVEDGQLCADIPGDTVDPWEAIIGQDDIPLAAGEVYTLTYTATATADVTIRVNVQEAEEPYATELTSDDEIGAEAEPVSHEFTAQSDNDAAQLAFQVGGNDAFTLCLDDISLTGAE